MFRLDISNPLYHWWPCIYRNEHNDSKQSPYKHSCDEDRIMLEVKLPTLGHPKKSLSPCVRVNFEVYIDPDKKPNESPL